VFSVGVIATRVWYCLLHSHVTICTNLSENLLQHDEVNVSSASKTVKSAKIEKCNKTKNEMMEMSYPGKNNLYLYAFSPISETILWLHNKKKHKAIEKTNY